MLEINKNLRNNTKCFSLTIALQLGYLGPVCPLWVCKPLISLQDYTSLYPRTLSIPLIDQRKAPVLRWKEAWQSNSWQGIVTTILEYPSSFHNHPFLLQLPNVFGSIGIRARTCRAWISIGFDEKNSQYEDIKGVKKNFQILSGFCGLKLDRFGGCLVGVFENCFYTVFGVELGNFWLWNLWIWRCG